LLRTVYQSITPVFDENLL